MLPGIKELNLLLNKNLNKILLDFVKEEVGIRAFLIQGNEKNGWLITQIKTVRSTINAPKSMLIPLLLHINESARKLHIGLYMQWQKKG